mmetsp:Transcript_11559/g.30080  ORF Transcript_11559/g.30080 Transcript_11559/m.30080 type:complete len:146 (+) Transcript_11559:31-468(+)
MVMRDRGGLFVCSVCDFECHYDDFGRQADQRLVFLEDVYTRKDEANPWRSVCIGAHCSICNAQACAREPCSVFYCQRFCAACGSAAKDVLPAEINRVLAKAPPVRGAEPRAAAADAGFVAAGSNSLVVSRSAQPVRPPRCQPCPN